MSGDGDGIRDLLARQSITRQHIELSGSDLCNSHSIYGRDVTITTSIIDATAKGSNKVSGQLNLSCIDEYFYFCDQKTIEKYVSILIKVIFI